MMKKVLLVMAALLAVNAGEVHAIPAFPGAEGGGAASVGGRGGRVILVTNLDDKGPGSLRQCMIESGPRTCVFRVAGTIQLNSTILLQNPFLTIAGQTAPGGGIALSGKNMPADMMRITDTHDLVMRYIRVRKGFHPAAQGQAGNNIWVNRSANMMFDHLTVTWNQDEGFGTNATGNMTLQYLIVAQAVGQEGQAHGTSWGILGKEPPQTVKMTNIDLHHNLTARARQRSVSAPARIRLRRRIGASGLS